MVASKGRVASANRAALPDLVYPVRAGENEELRYSLRSVATNAAGLYRKVWIVGHGLPDWLTGVEVIDAHGPESGQSDVRAKITAAANDPRVAARFVLLADDMFLVDPITRWEPFHMGPTSAFVAHLAKQGTTTVNSGWLRNVVATAEWMAEQGHGDILCRQGHRPLLWDKKKLAAALAAYPADRRLDTVGLYDLAGAAGEGRKAGNAKVGVDASQFHAKLAELDIPWLSSNDRAFAEGMIGGYIRGMFRTPSRYETA